MSLRSQYWSVAPAEHRALLSVWPRLKAVLGDSLVDLVFVRVSQMNGCAFCVDTHTNEALQRGESQRRLNGLVVWRDTPFFSEPERAALAWAELLTRVSDHGPLDESYDRLKSFFAEKEIVVLTFAISLINALNRVAIGFGRTPVSEPKQDT